MPLYSVIVPAYNRPDVLRRALDSVAAQTIADFDCLVVDDGSSEPLAPVVAEYDSRFRYLRRDTNGGCTAARLTGCEQARGELVAFLDSDNTFFPWTLERAAQQLETYPDAASAIGLYVFDNGFRVRVGGGARLVGPEEFAARSSPGALSDCVGVVRRRAVCEWMSADASYFNTDFALILRLHLNHQVVLVDEPWGRYDEAAGDRITHRNDPRELQDVARFIQDVRPLVGSTPCGPVDVVLIAMWTKLMRNRRYRDAEGLVEWMQERGISRGGALRRKLGWTIRARLARVIPMTPTVL